MSNQHIGIIGAGNAGVSLIESIRSRDKNTSITLFDTRKYYFEKAALFPWCVQQGECDIMAIDEFAGRQNVRLINTKVERINFSKKKLFLKEGEPVVCDKIVLCTGAKSKDLSIKGDQKDGFFYFSKIADPYAIRDLIRVSDDIIVYAATMEGLKAALMMSSLQGKELKIIAYSLDFLGDYRERISRALLSRGISVFSGVRIKEVIGEGTVRATRTDIPKVFSSHLVFVDSGYTPNRDLFDESIKPRGVFSTEIEGIYLLGKVKDDSLTDDFFFCRCPSEIKRQADALALYFTGAAGAQEPFLVHSKISREEEIKEAERFLHSIPVAYPLQVPVSPHPNPPL